MIKKLRYLCTLLLIAVASAAWADEESVTFSEQGYTNQQAIESYVGTNFTITFDKGTNSNAPKYFTNGTAIRAYGGNTFTVSSNYTITKIVLTFGGSDGTNEITTDEKTYLNGTWIGSANSVTFTIGGTIGNRRLSGVKVTYTVPIGDKIATTISFGADAQSSYTVYTNETFNAPTATVSAGETVLEDATITYTSTNEDVATVDADGAVAIVAAGLTTIKATYAGDDTYAGSSASYTLNVGNIFANLKALQDGTTSETAIPMKVTLENVQVTGVNGKNAYINDGTYGAIIYTDGHGLSEGQTITGTLVASSQLYNGAPEITNFSTTGLTINAGTLTPQEKTISDLSVANEGIYVTIKGLSYDATAATFSDGTSTIAYYDGLKKEIALEDGSNYNVTGVINYRNLLQLYPTAAEKLEAGVETPEFSLDAGSYKGTKTITLTQAANLPIYYTLDESDPTTSETAVEYNGAITIAKTTTVKAAAKDGDTWSNVVTREYTIVPLYESIAAMKAAITATAAADAVDMYVTLTNAVVTYINGSNYYIEDGSAGILIYNSSDGVKNFLTKTGLKLNGDMKAAGYIYNGLYELTKNFDFTGVTAEEGADIPVTEVTIAQLNENLLQYESKRVKVVDATVSSALASRKATIKQNGSSIQIYEKKQGNLAETALATANSVVTVVGYPGINNSTNQLNVWDAEDVTSTETPVVVPTPTFSPAAGEVEAGTEVKIVCPAEADGVEYSFDNTTWDEYTDPIEITEDITIYARAYDEDGNFSDVVSAAYTIKAVTPVVEGKSFVKVTSASDFSDGYYLVVYEKNEDSGNAFDGSLTTLDAANNYIAVAVAEGTIVATDENKASVFTITGSNDGYTIKSASGLYIGQTSDANGLKAQETALYNAITFGEDGEANIVSGGAYLRYNSTSGQDRFRYFKSSTYTSQQPVYLYKLTDQEPVTPKINPNLSFDETEFNVEPNAEFDEPTLNNQYEVAVTYSTTDAEIAAVDEATGNVTIGAKEGTATITAKFEGDETYMADEASYKITVKAVVVPTVDKYELVTDATTLTSGDKILIAYVGEDGATVMGVQQKNNRAGVVATVNTDNTITPNSDAQVITLENGWYFNVGTGYLYASSSDANQLKTETEADDNAKATIGIAQNEETGEVETTITFQGENTRNVMRFNPNSGNPLFACYASTSTTGFLPQIYRKVLLGDVNGDKKVDVADVTALVNLLLNESVSHNPTDHPAANLDEDEDLDADDVRALVEKVLSEE